MALLEVDDLEMVYRTREGDVRAVDSISFNLERGQALGIVGESGCGKSSLALTLLRIMPTNGRVVNGQILFEGQDLLEMSPEKFRQEVRWNRISMVFQGAMNAMNPVLQVGDQIAEAMEHHLGLSHKDALSRAAELFSLVGLDRDRLENYPHEFSGGMKQRAIIAMALSCNPDIVIADEPTTALDVIVQAQVLKALEGLRSEFGISLILITHDLSTVAQLCNQMAVMYAGQIVEYGSIESILQQSYHPYTQGLLRSFPDIDAEERMPIISIPGFPPNLIDPPSGCRFHPRCPMAVDRCVEEVPPFHEHAEVFSACHFADQLAKEGTSAWELTETKS